MMRVSFFFIAAGVLFLAACAASPPPVNYHTLLAPETGKVTAYSASPAADFLIDVQPIGMPVLLDQQQLLVRQGQSGVFLLEGERWLGTLGEEFRAALSTALVRQLGAQDIAGLPYPRGRTVVQVRVQIRRFDAWLGDGVQLEADWSLSMAGQSGKSLLCQSRLGLRTPGAYTELVQGQQKLVAALARQIARTAQPFTIAGRSAAASVECAQ